MLKQSLDFTACLQYQTAAGHCGTITQDFSVLLGDFGKTNPFVRCFQAA
jgi:hypothetical protein